MHFRRKKTWSHRSPGHFLPIHLNVPNTLLGKEEERRDFPCVLMQWIMITSGSALALNCFFGGWVRGPNSQLNLDNFKILKLFADNVKMQRRMKQHDLNLSLFDRPTVECLTRLLFCLISSKLLKRRKDQRGPEGAYIGRASIRGVISCR